MENTKETKRAKTPTLTCIVTGATRITNNDYLSQKAERFATSVDDIKAHYVTKDVLKALRAGDLQGLSQETADRVLALNGKQKSAKTELVEA